LEFYKELRKRKGQVKMGDIGLILIIIVTTILSGVYGYLLVKKYKKRVKEEGYTEKYFVIINEATNDVSFDISDII